MRLKQSIARWIRLAGLRTVVGSHIERNRLICTKLIGKDAEAVHTIDLSGLV